MSLFTCFNTSLQADIIIEYDLAKSRYKSLLLFYF